MNDFNFPVDGGPMIDGTWYNPQTGDSFTVRDSFFQDNQLMIQATDGRMFDYNTIQNYIKSDKPITIPQQKKTTELPKEILDEIEDVLPEDRELLQGRPNLYNSATPRPELKLPESQPELSEDERFIKRLLSRCTTPEIDVDVVWKNVPKKQLEMLRDYMGIDTELIANYYISSLDVESVRKQLAEKIAEYINHQLDGDNKTTVELDDDNKTAVEVTSKTTKPKTTTKSKNK